MKGKNTQQGTKFWSSPDEFLLVPLSDESLTAEQLFYPPHYLPDEDSESMTKSLDGSFHHKAKSSWLPEN